MSKELLVVIVVEYMRERESIESPGESQVSVPFEIILAVINSLSDSVPADTILLLNFAREI